MCRSSIMGNLPSARRLWRDDWAPVEDGPSQWQLAMVATGSNPSFIRANSKSINNTLLKQLPKIRSCNSKWCMINSRSSGSSKNYYSRFSKSSSNNSSNNNSFNRCNKIWWICRCRWIMDSLVVKCQVCNTCITSSNSNPISSINWWEAWFPVVPSSLEAKPFNSILWIYLAHLVHPAAAPKTLSATCLRKMQERIQTVTSVLRSARMVLRASNYHASMLFAVLV